MLPLLYDLNSKIAKEPQVTIQALFSELEHAARKEIQVVETSDFTGGLSTVASQITSYDLNVSLHNFRSKLN